MKKDNRISKLSLAAIGAVAGSFVMLAQAQALDVKEAPKASVEKTENVRIQLAEAKTEAPAGEAKSHTIKAAGVRFKPAFIYINPGDTVNFENMPSHNVETLDALVPEGQEKIKTTLGDNVSLKFDKVGMVVFKCTPHWGNRMGGVIVVGKPENPEALIDDYMARTGKPENKITLPARGLLKKLKKDMKKKGLL